VYSFEKKAFIQDELGQRKKMESIISAIITCSGALISAIIAASASIIASRGKYRSMSPDQPEEKPTPHDAAERKPLPPLIKRNILTAGRILGTASSIVSIIFLCGLIITRSLLGLPGLLGDISGILGYTFGILGFLTGVVAIVGGRKRVGIASLVLDAAGFIITLVVIAIYAIKPFFQGGTFQW